MLGSARPASRSGGDFSGLRGRAPKKNPADRDGSAYVSAGQREGKKPPAERGSGRRVKRSGKATVGGLAPPRIIQTAHVTQRKAQLIHMVELSPRKPRLQCDALDGAEHLRS